ncbi:hypothetical protein FE782_21570 [Paenibacillus antri]|uniref:Isoprenylcysteine carboxyl methyltransferase n=1 Tax=Paenibacillus antri TaxID=2582848 RepID=A0A5R9GA59_9BACL|nr:isoprenylcysteine carboxylmethyltransferase family protein [Paenibacillus antri]TLS50258.1 hypothetical protein FE782_21570 [Paenibacillus antri]
MSLWFALWFGAVVVQRLAELRLAKRNAERLRRIGGYEVDAAFYPKIVLLHASFFACVFAEFLWRRPEPSPWMAAAAAAFLLLQAGRVWCIRSLGPYWNTRVFVVPGMKLVRKGPYRWMKHPNYLVVTLEMLAFPLLFGCFGAACLFPALNVLLLRRRIAAEEAALRAASA